LAYEVLQVEWSETTDTPQNEGHYLLYINFKNFGKYLRCCQRQP